MSEKQTYQYSGSLINQIILYLWLFIFFVV